jgi:DNA-binding NtrC family response regulator
MNREVLALSSDGTLRRRMTMLLEASGYVVRSVSCAKEALTQLDHFDGVVVSDMQLSDTDAPSFLRSVRAVAEELPVIFVTQVGNTMAALEVVRAGAYQLVERDGLRDRLVRTVSGAFEALAEARVAREPTASGRVKPLFGRILTQAPEMMPVFRSIGSGSETDVAMLICGESGTGKELVARAVHENGTRSEGPFLAINCAGIPEPLLEAELFGYERGAFTGADSRHIGTFEAASGGTLLLDEVGEMHPALQAKLLRVLQEGEFQRLGSSDVIKANVRILAATNRDLEDEIEQGRFRADLYYRLAVYTVYMPPLRERTGDIALLTRHFLRQFSEREHKPLRGIDARAAELLELHDFPGNVRELENIISYAVVSCRDDIVTMADLPPSFLRAVWRRYERVESERDGPLATPPTPPAELKPLAAVEREHIGHVMRATQGNKTLASNILGISRMTLYRKLDEYGFGATEDDAVPN